MVNAFKQMHIEKGIKKLMDEVANMELDDYEQQPIEEKNDVERDFLDQILQDMSKEQRLKLAQRLQSENEAETQSALRREYENQLRELASKMRGHPFFKTECEKLRAKYRKKGLYI